LKALIPLFSFDLMQKFKSEIVCLSNFINSTRDSGYKSTSSALAELVDNSLEAGARHVHIKYKKK
jgi:hypothetical protein